MHVTANQISRDWTVRHQGRTFYVNFTESDGQSLALCNRNNWEVWEETDDGVAELNEFVFKDDTAQERADVEENSLLKERLIRFCLENWDNKFIHELKEKLQGQKQLLGGILDD